MAFITGISIEGIQSAGDLAKVLRTLLDDQIGRQSADVIPPYHEAGATSPPAFDDSCPRFVLDISDGNDRLFEVSVTEIDESPRSRVWGPVYEQMARDAHAKEQAEAAEEAAAEKHVKKTAKKPARKPV